MTIDVKVTERILHRQGIGKLRHIDVTYRTRSDPRDYDCVESGVKKNVVDLGTKSLSKVVTTKHCLTLEHVNIDEEMFRVDRE